MVPIVSPDGINASSTGLSNPPPAIDSRPVPSGRHRQIRALVPFRVSPSFVLISNPRLASVIYIHPSGPKNGPPTDAPSRYSLHPVTITSRLSATPSPSVSVIRKRSGEEHTYRLPL